MKKLLGIIVFNLLLSGNAYANEKLIFPFTVDEQIQTFKDGGEKIVTNKSNELIKDEYWNTPLTKLDYYLIQLKNKADETSKEIGKIYSDGSAYLLEYFDRIEYLKKYQKLFGKYESFSITNRVFYDEIKGKIIISFDISGVGKQKKPMKELCKILIDKKLFLNGMPDQSYNRPSNHRFLLNQLYRGGTWKKNYDQQLKKIANNIVYKVNITSKVSTSSEKMNYNLFGVSCFKLNDKDKIIYRKWSSESNE